MRQVQGKRTATIKLISKRNKKRLRLAQKTGTLTTLNAGSTWLGYSPHTYPSPRPLPLPLTQSINSSCPYPQLAVVCFLMSVLCFVLSVVCFVLCFLSAFCFGCSPCAINLIAPINMQHLAVIIARARLFICPAFVLPSPSLFTSPCPFLHTVRILHEAPKPKSMH